MDAVAKVAEIVESGAAGGAGLEVGRGAGLEVRRGAGLEVKKEA